MKYRLYTTSKKAWTAMLSAISSAQSSVYIEMYIFLDDTASSHDFIGKLLEKAEAGVRIIIVADALGSAGLKSATIKTLRTAGVEVLFFSHWLRRTHRKIVIVDKKLAFLGGVNIENKTGHWDDLVIRFGGKHLVRPLLRTFAYTYKMSGGKNNALLRDYRVSLVRKIKSFILENLPTHGIRSLSDYYRDRIIGAKHSLKIVTPYFAPPRWLIALLDDASRRGVQLEIIIPLDTDIKILNRINYHYMARLIPSGVKFYGSRRMNHAKMIIIDNHEGLIGSQNLDILSFGRNIESGVFFRQHDLVRDLNFVFEHWKKNCKPFSLAHRTLKPADYLVLAIIRLARPWL